MESIRTYLEMAVREGAADLFLIAGKAISIKINGEIRAVGEERLMPGSSAALVR